MKKYLHKDYFDYEDTTSDCMLKAYAAVHTFDFTRGYIDCRNLLSTVIANHCKNMYAYRDASRRIPQHLIGSFCTMNHEEQDIFEHTVTNKELANINYHCNRAEQDSKSLDVNQYDKLTLLIEHAEHAKDPLVSDIIALYLDGWSYPEIGKMLGEDYNYPNVIIKKFKKHLQTKGIIKPMIMLTEDNDTGYSDGI
jgi:DNA-directed RNA polymerase specialized sigma24 family protein